MTSPVAAATQEEFGSGRHPGCRRCLPELDKTKANQTKADKDKDKEKGKEKEKERITSVMIIMIIRGFFFLFSAVRPARDGTGSREENQPACARKTRTFRFF